MRDRAWLLALCYAQLAGAAVARDTCDLSWRLTAGQRFDVVMQREFAWTAAVTDETTESTTVEIVWEGELIVLHSEDDIATCFLVPSRFLKRIVFDADDERCLEMDANDPMDVDDYAVRWLTPDVVEVRNTGEMTFVASGLLADEPGPVGCLGGLCLPGMRRKVGHQWIADEEDPDGPRLELLAIENHRGARVAKAGIAPESAHDSVPFGSDAGTLLWSADLSLGCDGGYIRHLTLQTPFSAEGELDEHTAFESSGYFLASFWCTEKHPAAP